jgi:hypothetical protein
MPDEPITLFPAATAIFNTDLLAIVQDGITKHAAAGLLRDPAPPPPTFIPGLEVLSGQTSAPMNLSIGVAQVLLGTQVNFALDRTTVVVALGTFSAWRAQAPGYPDDNMDVLVQGQLSYDFNGAETVRFGADIWLPWINQQGSVHQNRDDARQLTYPWWLLLSPGSYSMRLKVSNETPDSRVIMDNDFGRSKLIVFIPRLVQDLSHYRITTTGNRRITTAGDPRRTTGILP